MYYIQETGESSQIEAILGSWRLAAEDSERSTATQAQHAWDLAFGTSSSTIGIDLDETSFRLLFSFVKRALLDPLAVYADLNPVQPAVAPTLPPHAAPRNKGATKRPPFGQVVEEDSQLRRPDEEEESESDRKGRLRASSLGVLKWIVGTLLSSCSCAQLK